MKKIDTQGDVDLLRHYYLVEKMSTVDIEKHSVDIFGKYISRGTVYRSIIKNKIKIRSKSSSVSVSKRNLDYDKSFLTDRMTEWFDGFLLGDGSLRFSNAYFKKHNDVKYARISMGSVKKEWTEYAMSGFTPYLMNGNIDIGEYIYEDSPRHPNPLYLSRSLGHPDIAFQVKRWYPLPKTKKVIPKDIRITPISVMLWYLGDGSFHYSEKNSSQLRIATCSFKREDLVGIILPKLKDLNINSYVDKYKNDIHICTESIKNFFNLIGWKSPISCYDHKFNIPYWLRLNRLSNVVNNNRDKWLVQSWCRSGMVEFSKSPNGRFFLFTDEQKEKIRKKLRK